MALNKLNKTFIGISRNMEDGDFDDDDIFDSQYSISGNDLTKKVQESLVALRTFLLAKGMNSLAAKMLSRLAEAGMTANDPIVRALMAITPENALKSLTTELPLVEENLDATVLEQHDGTETTKKKTRRKSSIATSLKPPTNMKRKSNAGVLPQKAQPSETKRRESHTLKPGLNERRASSKPKDNAANIAAMEKNIDDNMSPSEWKTGDDSSEIQPQTTSVSTLPPINAEPRPSQVTKSEPQFATLPILDANKLKKKESKLPSRPLYVAPNLFGVYGQRQLHKYNHDKWWSPVDRQIIRPPNTLHEPWDLDKVAHVIVDRDLPVYNNYESRMETVVKLMSMARFHASIKY
ncbi:hypothetical protein BCR33DRAFT_715421 [Rhizoclosmatium globosum]|uniref:Uncharacterized protein n=1 Tax=Rhizoclosmatium globosum TaxID=329046 RepID=A0A1Y2CJ29_9FUNG|nr:hypothetical protein BCR33DRAFT_715421 [Rhizoclosmatium globosum]|eukprot:ORY47051.1 hypothetical protein BCR33DRAFT_715421 [Rhizoclosmatium globosum]